MESKTLSPQALQVIENYLHLPFQSRSISCPYFNNKRHGVRGALRVTIGKGTPEEIVDEAMLFGLREKTDLKNLSDEELKHFLVDHNLGIDCSGLAYYILDAQYYSIHKKNLKKYIHFETGNPLRKLITLLRPAENTGALTFANDKNSKVVSLSDVKPGDFVAILYSGREKNFHHMVTIHQVDYENGKPAVLHYTHTLDWRVDGKYNHGVKQGRIEIVDLSRPVLEQKWVENNVSGDENETWVKAKEAERVELRRIRC